MKIEEFDEMIDKIVKNIGKLQGSSLCFVSENNYLYKEFVREILLRIPNLNINDVLFVMPENGNIKIDKIREIIDFILYKPNFSDQRIILIEEIDAMTLEAANASLKVLEEPPQYSLIFAATSRWDYLLPTIKSRFIKFELPLPKAYWQEIENKYGELSIYLKIFQHIDTDVLYYLKDQATDISEIKKAINDILNLSYDNFEQLLEIFKLPLNVPFNKLKFDLSYFKLFEILLKLSPQELFNCYKNILKIKNDIDSYTFLKKISSLAQLLIRDSLVSISTTKWKYFWNSSLVYFFGFNEYKVDTKIVKEYLEYLNSILNSKVSNFNFEMEIFSHFLRLKRCFIN